MSSRSAMLSLKEAEILWRWLSNAVGSISRLAVRESVKDAENDRVTRGWYVVGDAEDDQECRRGEC